MASIFLVKRSGAALRRAGNYLRTMDIRSLAPEHRRAVTFVQASNVKLLHTERVKVDQLAHHPSSGTGTGTGTGSGTNNEVNSANGNGNRNGNGDRISSIPGMRMFNGFDVWQNLEAIMNLLDPSKAAAFIAMLGKKCYDIVASRDTDVYPKDGFLDAPKGELRFKITAPGERDDMSLTVDDKTKTFILEMRGEEWGYYRRTIKLPKDANYENAVYTAHLKNGALYVSLKDYEPKIVKVLFSDAYKKPKAT